MVSHRSKLTAPYSVCAAFVLNKIKAFDTVDHVILLSKLVQLKLPGFVINWICSFLSGRGQQCKVNGA